MIDVKAAVALHPTWSYVQRQASNQDGCLRKVAWESACYKDAGALMALCIVCFDDCCVMGAAFAYMSGAAIKEEAELSSFR